MTFKGKIVLGKPFQDAISLKTWRRPIGYTWAKETRYQPHQGRAEIARRAKQIQSGKLAISV